MLFARCSGPRALVGDAVRQATIAIVLICLALIFGAAAQPTDTDAPVRDFDLPRVGGELMISDPAAVPRQLVRALERDHCIYKDELRHVPLRFVRTKEARLAIVPCRLGAALSSHRVYLFSHWSREPTVLAFPLLTGNGIVAGSNPGLIIWPLGSSTLQAVSVTDVCPSPAIRHTYHVGPNRAFLQSDTPFALDRVEVIEDRCGAMDNDYRGPWRVVWEASRLPETLFPR